MLTSDHFPREPVFISFTQTMRLDLRGRY